MQLRVSELASLCGHLVHFAIVDHGHNGVFAPTMQPNVIR